MAALPSFIRPKRLHVLVLKAFVGPFAVTFIVAVFLLLTQFLLKYLDELTGKGLGAGVFSELIFYLSFNMYPRALPLAVLLASLMTFGNLGQYNELTAIKSAGISMVRIMAPVFWVVVGLTFASFLFYETILPVTNGAGYSLLYDARHKKPSLSLTEGAFYGGLQHFSIRVEKKDEKGDLLRGVMIYDHREKRGNADLIVADSGRMYTTADQKQLALELFSGTRYYEYRSEKNSHNSTEFVRMGFERLQIFFDLSEFEMSRTDQEQFSSNSLLMTRSELHHEIDSLKVRIDKMHEDGVNRFPQHNHYWGRNQRGSDTLGPIANKPEFSLDSLTGPEKGNLLKNAINGVRTKVFAVEGRIETEKGFQKRIAENQVNILMKSAAAVTCIIMFLIGAPLGAIVKKGGLGMPVLLATIFFVIYYVISMIGEKMAKQLVISPEVGMWMANVALLPFGLLFINLARKDASLFDYSLTAWIHRLRARVKGKKKAKEEEEES